MSTGGTDHSSTTAAQRIRGDKQVIFQENIKHSTLPKQMASVLTLARSCSQHLKLPVCVVRLECECQVHDAGVWWMWKTHHRLENTGGFVSIYGDNAKKRKWKICQVAYFSAPSAALLFRKDYKPSSHCSTGWHVLITFNVETGSSGFSQAHIHHHHGAPWSNKYVLWCCSK